MLRSRPVQGRRILDAAAQAFHDKGFHGVGVDELGHRAGISGPSLYRHFSGKQEILATLLNEAMDELMAATVPAHEDPEADLQNAIRHHVSFAIRRRQLVTLYQREVGCLEDPWAIAFDRRRRQYTHSWEALVSRRFPSVPAATVPATTQACLGTLFSVAAWPARALAAPDIEDLLVDLVCRGLYGHASAD